MQLKVKPKKYGPVSVHSDHAQALTHGGDSPFAANAGPATSAPAMGMLASLATCIAMSIHGRAKLDQIKLNPFSVHVTGVKALDMPSRFETIEIEVKEATSVGRQISEEFVQRSKEFCTVSNTLNCTLQFLIT